MKEYFCKQCSASVDEPDILCWRCDEVLAMKSGVRNKTTSKEMQIHKLIQSDEKRYFTYFGRIRKDVLASFLVLLMIGLIYVIASR